LVEIRRIFSTPVTPTRERLTRVAGVRAWTSETSSVMGRPGIEDIGQDENTESGVESSAAEGAPVGGVGRTRCRQLADRRWVK
jgi:hypothetical protein